MARPIRTQLQKALVGHAGEHYVLFRLYQQGMLASLAPPGSEKVDVLVMAPDESVIATLQVKTRTYGRDQGWHMSVKHENFAAPRAFYALVDLEPQIPVTYIVPSEVVAQVVHDEHAAWLGTPGVRGQQHKANDVRRLLPKYRLEVPSAPDGWMEPHRENWQALKQSARTRKAH